jgi:hypothetical protein
VTPPSDPRANALVLDFANVSAPLVDILPSGTALVFGGSGTANGGALQLNGKTGSANSQTVAGTTLNQGQSFLSLNAGSAASMTVNLGNLTRNAGGLLDVMLPPVGTVSVTASNINGILGAWATVSGTGVVGAALDWATVSGGTLAAYGGYTDVTVSGSTLTSNAASNVRINAGTTTTTSVGVGVTDINTLLLKNNNAALNIATGGTLRLGASGGVLLVSGA